MKKRIIMAMAALSIFAMIGCQKADTKEAPAKVEEAKEEVVEATEEVVSDTDATPAEEEQMDLLSGMYYVCISVKDYGDIFVELDADVAPITVTNFMNLVNSDFYSNLTFHRIIDGFMIQGGDPTGTGMGGSGKYIKGEFFDNGVENNIAHERGTISMARSNNYDSASSQFFICQQDSYYLDGQYAGFGHVLSGMEVVDAICADTPVLNSNGAVAPENQPVITGIYDMTAEHEYDEASADMFIPSNAMEEAVGRDEFESYDDVISCLSPGMGYAYIDVLGAEGKKENMLIIATQLYDNLDGNMVTIEAYPYIIDGDRVTCGSVITSNGTAYPIAVSDDGILYGGGNHDVQASCLNEDASLRGIMCMASISELFDEDANVSYSGFVRTKNNFDEENETWFDGTDDAYYKEYTDKFRKANIINFTVVE